MRSRANSNDSEERIIAGTPPRRRTASANDAEIDANHSRNLSRSAGTTPDRSVNRRIRNLELFNQYSQESRNNNPASSPSSRPITFTVSQPQPKFTQQPRPRGSSHNSSNTWQSRTLEFAQTYQGHTAHMNFQGTVMMSHVELSKQIQQQQMHAAFRHLGFSVPVRRNTNSDESNTSTLSYTSLDNLNNLGQEIRPHSRPSSRSNSNDNSIIGDGLSLFTSAVNVIGSGFGLINNNIHTEVNREVKSSNTDSFKNIPSPTLGSDYTLGDIDIEEEFSPVSHSAISNYKKSRNVISPFPTGDNNGDGSSNQPKLSRTDGSKSSINDFGYRKNSFHIFGNQFDE